MKPIHKTGLVLGVLVVIWMFIVGFAGWYKDAVLLNLFYVVILIQIGVLIWGLRFTAREGRGYGGQVGAGMLMSVIGGVIIFFGSILFTSVAFPDYFEEVRRAGEEVLRGQGMSDADIRTYLDQQAAMQTPFVNALTGFIATLVTGLIVSLIAAAFLRKKPKLAPAPDKPTHE
ncbi:MAG: DUF4199 domain-containing protein [Ignavibacteria bacterium]|nr:DUF4199 domain-containing protein [Ignavibacteria bacterium]